MVMVIEKRKRLNENVCRAVAWFHKHKMKRLGMLIINGYKSTVGEYKEYYWRVN